MNIAEYISQHPGLETRPVSHHLRVANGEGPMAGLVQRPVGQSVDVALGYGWNSAHKYGALAVTETKDNSSTIAYAAGGVRFQAQATPSDNDDTAINTTETVTLAVGKEYWFGMRVQVSSAANYGFTAGFVTSGSTEIFTAAPADGVYFIKAKNAATVALAVNENTNAAVNSTTTATLSDATDIYLVFRFRCGSPTETTATKANSIGEWYYGTDPDALTRVGFTSSQLDSLILLVNTTAPTLAGHLGFRVNSTTQRSGTVKWARWEVEN